MAHVQVLGRCRSQFRTHRRCSGPVLCPIRSDNEIRYVRYRRFGTNGVKLTSLSLESKDCFKMEWVGSRISLERRISSLPRYT